MLVDRIDAIVARTLAESEAEGMAIGISLPSGERLLRTYGFANRDAGTLVAPKTLFEIGSISKSFLGIVFMQLEADGRIDLHAPVTDYLPWFSVKSEYGPITTHHLLCHTAGLPTGFAHRPDGLWELWELRNVRVGEPGAYWHYSDVGYSLLGVLAEAVTGQSFAQLMQERVLDPLGFANSTSAVTTAQRPALAMGCKRQYDDRPFRSGMPVYPATWMETSSGAGSIVMDISDMLGYAEFLQCTSHGADSRVLTSAQLRAMVDPARLPEPAVEETYGYGLYWGTDDDSGETIYVSHGGDMVGYESDLLVDLLNGISVVMLANGGVPDYQLTNELRKLAVASIAEDDLPELSTETLRVYDGAEAWVGAWHSSEREMEIVLDDDGLGMLICDKRIPLQRYSRRSNYSLTLDDSDWDRFLFEAERDDADEDGTLGPIVGINYGFEAFVRAEEPVPAIPDYPEEWNGFVGLYRTYNPWYPGVRVVLRNGKLMLCDSYGSSSELVPEGDGFRVGVEPPNFDWLEFTPIIDGQAQGIRFETGAEYNRFFAD